MNTLCIQTLKNKLEQNLMPNKMILMCNRNQNYKK